MAQFQILKKNYHDTYQTYIFMIYDYNHFYLQTMFGKVFWVLSVLLMTMLGLYWTITLYIDWRANPVVTTVSTLAYPIEKVTKLKMQ